jgi:hypothetical protein
VEESILETGLSENPLDQNNSVLNFNDLALNFFTKVEDAEGGFMNKRAGGRAGVEEVNPVRGSSSF